MFSKSNKGSPSGGASAGVPSSKPQNTRSAGGVPSILSSEMRLIGDIVSEGDLQVDGSVEGDVRCQTLTIGEHGSLTGEVHAETVRLHGKVTGQVFGRTVYLSKTARMVGDVAHESLAIEPGAFMEGHCRHMEDPMRHEGKRSDKLLLAEAGAASEPTSYGSATGGTSRSVGETTDSNDSSSKTSSTTGRKEAAKEKEKEQSA